MSCISQLCEIQPEKGVFVVLALDILELSGMWSSGEAIHFGFYFKDFITREAKRKSLKGRRYRLFSLSVSHIHRHRHTDSQVHAHT